LVIIPNLVKLILSLVSAKIRTANNRHACLLRHQRKVSVPGYCHVTSFVSFKNVNDSIII